VAQFLLELYVSRVEGDAAVERDAAQARLGAEALTQEGRPVRYLRSIFLPEEETCFFLFEAESAEDVEEAARRASLAVDRAAGVIAGRFGEEES
jgi:hypothetical protein